MIEAAGGVVWRRTSRGEVEVLVVHRPRYDDWSLPKGKLDAGETHERAAVREVEEETGLRCEGGVELASVRYQDSEGRDKHVRYWAMQPVAGRFVPNDEVDEVRWVPLDDLRDLVTHERDADVAAGVAPQAG